MWCLPTACAVLPVERWHFLDRLGTTTRYSRSGGRKRWRLHARSARLHMAYLLRRERVEWDPDGAADQSNFPVLRGDFLPVGDRIWKRGDNGSAGRLSYRWSRRGVPRADEQHPPICVHRHRLRHRRLVTAAVVPKFSQFLLEVTDRSYVPTLVVLICVKLFSVNASYLPGTVWISLMLMYVPLLLLKD